VNCCGPKRELNVIPMADLITKKRRIVEAGHSGKFPAALRAGREHNGVRLRTHACQQPEASHGFARSGQRRRVPHLQGQRCASMLPDMQGAVGKKAGESMACLAWSTESRRVRGWPDGGFKVFCAGARVRAHACRQPVMPGRERAGQIGKRPGGKCVPRSGAAGR
jgi:hypothetical protein